MGHTKPTIEHLHLQRGDDDQFIANISDLADQEGNEIYQSVFRELINLELPPESAQIHWQKLLLHRENLAQVLGRTVSLLASLNDYFSTFASQETEPSLLDSNIFSRFLLESTNDKLTGLNNRAYFDEVFEQQLSLAKRYNTDLTIIFLDLDNFKGVNDQFGHQAGDAVLKQTAAVISKKKRDSDIAVRYGGEEFILLMPHTGKINGHILAERIRKAIAATTLTFNEITCSITVSGGLASYPDDGETTTDILRTADRGLYQAKGAGKNTISIFREDKRRYLRVKFKNKVFVKELDLDANITYKGTGKDICIGGILFENSEPLTLGSKVQLYTSVRKDRSLLLIGKVVRVEAFGPNEYDIGVALSFNELEKVAKEEIAGLLRADY